MGGVCARRGCAPDKKRIRTVTKVVRNTGADLTGTVGANTPGEKFSGCIAPKRTGP